MLLRVLGFFKKPTSRDVIVNTLGNYLNVFFTALFALILVRILNPSQYGVLSVLLGIAYVLANVLDFGTTATIYSYLPVLYEKRSKEMYRFIKSTFFYQSLFSFVVIGILFITFPFLDRVFFKTHAPEWELYLTAFSVLFLIWQNFVQNIMFAAKKFIHTNIFLNVANVLKTVVVLFLVYAKMVTVGSVIFVFGILGPLIFFTLLFIEKKDRVYVLAKAEIRREDFRFGYTLTYFLASQFFNLGLRMDLFLLSYFRSKAEVGFYGLSQKIILTVITTVVSITQVLSPGFSKIKTKSEARQQFKNGFYYLLLPCGLFLLLYLLPPSVYELFFTDRFMKTIPITKALSLPFIIYALGSVPMLFLLYSVKKPAYILLSNIVFFGLLTSICFQLIPRMGFRGPPIAIAVAMSVAVVVQVMGTIKEYRTLPEK